MFGSNDGSGGRDDGWDESDVDSINGDWNVVIVLTMITSIVVKYWWWMVTITGEGAMKNANKEQKLEKLEGNKFKTG